MKRIKKLFIKGLFTILPLAITFYLIFWLISSLDALVKQIILLFTDFYIPGMGFILALLIILAVGVLANNFLGRWVIRISELVLSKVPIVKNIYGSISDIQKTFTNNPTKRFSQVVLVDYPLKGTKSMGFIASDQVMLNDEERVSVFLPTTPNPTNGFLLFFDKKDIVLLDIPVDTAIKMIVSMGTYQPEKLTP